MFCSILGVYGFGSDVNKTFCQDKDQDQDYFFCPRGASRPRLWSRGLHHWGLVSFELALLAKNRTESSCNISISLDRRETSTTFENVVDAIQFLDLTASCLTLPTDLPVRLAKLTKAELPVSQNSRPLIFTIIRQM